MYLVLQARSQVKDLLDAISFSLAQGSSRQEEVKALLTMLIKSQRNEKLWNVTLATLKYAPLRSYTDLRNRL